MASAQQKRQQRSQLRDQGFKFLEVCLPSQTVERIDRLKTALGAESRNEVLLHLIHGTLDDASLPADSAKMELGMQ